MNKLFDLTEKKVVIFGGNGYLGREFCNELLNFGAEVHSCDISHTSHPETDHLKTSYPQKYFEHDIDGTSKDELKVLCEQIGGIDVLINSTTSKGDDFYLPFEDVSLEGWEIGIQGNMTLPFLTMQAFIPMMKKKRSGSIINISSHYGVVGNDQRIYIGSNLNNVYTPEGESNDERIYSHGVYNATKAGIINLTRYLAAYYGEYNIRVNCISPGGVDHPGENEAFVKKYSEKVPLGRKAERSEMNGALIFLASDSSSYVTGHNLLVDGGYTIW